MRTSFTKEKLVAITERKHHSLVTIAARDGKEYDMNRIRRRSRQIAKSIRTSIEEEEEKMSIESITVCGEKGKVEVSSCNLEEGSCCGHSGAQLRSNSAPPSARSSVACFPPVSCCLWVRWRSSSVCNRNILGHHYQKDLWYTIGISRISSTCSYSSLRTLAVVGEAVVPHH